MSLGLFNLCNISFLICITAHRSVIIGPYTFKRSRVLKVSCENAEAASAMFMEHWHDYVGYAVSLRFVLGHPRNRQYWLSDSSTDTATCDRFCSFPNMGFLATKVTYFEPATSATLSHVSWRGSPGIWLYFLLSAVAESFLMRHGNSERRLLFRHLILFKFSAPLKLARRSKMGQWEQMQNVISKNWAGTWDMRGFVFMHMSFCFFVFRAWRSNLRIP